MRTALEAALAGEREERADAGVLADEAADRQARRTREATALRFEGRYAEATTADDEAAGRAPERCV